jgi:hypothetical protein
VAPSHVQLLSSSRCFIALNLFTWKNLPLFCLRAPRISQKLFTLRAGEIPLIRRINTTNRAGKFPPLARQDDKVLSCRKEDKKSISRIALDFLSFQTWPYIFQQVPDLNANKVSITSPKELARKSEFTAASESFHKFSSYDDSHIRSVTGYEMRCHDDFELSYD